MRIHIYLKNKRQQEEIRASDTYYLPGNRDVDDHEAAWSRFDQGQVEIDEEIALSGHLEPKMKEPTPAKKRDLKATEAGREKLKRKRRQNRQNKKAKKQQEKAEELEVLQRQYADVRRQDGDESDSQVPPRSTSVTRRRHKKLPRPRLG